MSQNTSQLILIWVFFGKKKNKTKQNTKRKPHKNKENITKIFLMTWQRRLRSASLLQRTRLKILVFHGWKPKARSFKGHSLSHNRPWDARAVITHRCTRGIAQGSLPDPANTFGDSKGTLIVAHDRATAQEPSSLLHPTSHFLRR